jgi:cytochrome c556
MNVQQKGEKMHQSKLLGLGLFALLSLFYMSAELFAQDDVIDKRKSLMKANNADVKAIGKAAEEKDYATVEAKAKEIMGNMDKVVDLFPKGSISEKSRAHPDIWEKTDEFKKNATKVRQAAEALSKAAAAKNEAEVNVKVKELGNVREGACGNCHKAFRADFRAEKEKKGG